MTAFAFSTVASIVSEPGAAARLGPLIAERFPEARRVLIVTDPGFLRTGLLEPARASLEQAGHGGQHLLGRRGRPARSTSSTRPWNSHASTGSTW